MAPDLRAYASQLLCRVLGVIEPAAVDAALEARLRSIGDGTDAPGLDAGSRSAALLALADWQLHAGRPAQAQHEVERVLAEGGERSASAAELAWGRTLLGVALMQQGRLADALRWFEQADAEHARLLGADHPMTLMFALNRALALHGLGRGAEAAAIVQRAEPVLRAAMGDAAPTYIRLLELKKRLEATDPRPPVPQPRRDSGATHPPAPPSQELFFV